MKKRNAAREQKIKLGRNAREAFDYALDVIEDRWPEAEELIKKSGWAYLYAKEVIKGRWPEAEEYIKKDSACAYCYAKNVIKGRWPEAEEYIKSDAYFWNRYKSKICKECNGEGIIDLGMGGLEDECPTCFGKGFDPAKLPD